VISFFAPSNTVVFNTVSAMCCPPFKGRLHYQAPRVNLLRVREWCYYCT
jgi:hypothetical protein